MSDFGAPVVNWRPLPRAARQTSACASRFSRSEKKTAGGFGGRCKQAPPTGFGAEPRKILSFMS